MRAPCVLLIALVVAACGQKGPLVLRGAKPATTVPHGAAPPTTPATPADAQGAPAAPAPAATPKG